MNTINKQSRLDAKMRARTALSRLMSCDAVSRRLAVGVSWPIHEFDILDSLVRISANGLEVEPCE